MLIESRTIRSLLNTKFTSFPHHPTCRNPDHIPPAPPDQYSVPINPIPALVILLLGIMMSSHTQGTMTSTMIHKQWGQLLAGAAFARAGTYVLLWLRPPKSVLPSRPPTELLVAFGLIAGGVIFMASVRLCPSLALLRVISIGFSPDKGDGKSGLPYDMADSAFSLVILSILWFTTDSMLCLCTQSRWALSDC